MKKILPLMLLAVITAVSCSKTETANTPADELAGRWQLISITDHDAGTVIQKTPEVTGNVELTFSFTGSGHGDISATTTANTLTGTFTTRNGRLISATSEYTKIDEPAFGSVLLCNVQYLQDYSFDDTRRLVINTSSRKTLLLERK